MRWTTAKIRQSFLDFFRERGHAVVESAPLVPKGDPTLLFTNAGMVPFKDYFLGIRTPPARRVVNCQKCLRISGKHNDLEAVGRDTYHHTFFEMLGNWSFGDYYKREAVQWHWQLVTKVWGIDPGRLWATVYKDDDEAEEAWREVKDLPKGRVLRFGEKENFWEMGETGPCGPCSEIHIDRGAEACGGNTHPGVDCAVNVDGCERFIELGNLVFIQYNRDASGKLSLLPMKCVDTGTGLERVAAVLQGLEQGTVLGNYDIDVFRAIIRRIEDFTTGTHKVIPGSGTPKAWRYKESAEKDISFRAIADHARAISFLIAEGVVPGNTEREYVLRRIIRRAARHGRYLGIHGPFLAEICEAVRQAMGEAYKELQTHAGRIASVVTEEEQRFSDTLDRGLELIDTERKRFLSAGLQLAEEVEKLEGRVPQKGPLIMPGEVAFRLYDTYGFPLDLTQDILRSDGIEVDVDEFNRLMEEQRERARAARREETLAPELKLGAGTFSRFIGYDTCDAESEILATGAGNGESLAIVVAETPFYPEGGGQVGDRGVIRADSGALLEVTDTRKADGAIVHLGKLLHGDAAEFKRGHRVALKVDHIRRDAAMLNHSATHILHYALRDVLGPHVHQAGSLVAPDRLRFDFHHQGPISEADLHTIEEEVNARIRDNAEVRTDEMPYDEAIKAGALAFFGDKYGDRVRVVRIGDFSVELCGGTHVSRTGQIGFFKLEAESGIAAGVRRIEALTAQGALEAIRHREQVLEEIGHYLGARGTQALGRLERLLEREKELEKKVRALESKLAAGGGGAGAESVRVIGGVKVVTRRVEGIEARALREMADRMRAEHGSCVAVIGSDLGDKVALVAGVTPDLTNRVNAGEIIKQLAPIVGGSGGGRPDFAQAGGKDRSKLDEALEHVAALVGR